MLAFGVLGGADNAILVLLESEVAVLPWMVGPLDAAVFLRHRSLGLVGTPAAAAACLRHDTPGRGLAELRSVPVRHVLFVRPPPSLVRPLSGARLGPWAGLPQVPCRLGLQSAELDEHVDGHDEEADVA